MVSNTLMLARARLLRPHTYRTATINGASKDILLPHDALAGKLFALTKEEWLRSLNDFVHTHRFQTFEDFVSGEGLTAEVEEALPFVQDGRALVAVIRKYVSDYIDVFYADDAAVVDDSELQTYWAHYGPQPLWPSYRLPPLSKTALVEQITQSIFAVTGVHEFVGAIVEYLQSPAGLGDLKHVVLHDGQERGQRDQVSSVLDAFQDDLQRLGTEIDARNAIREKRFIAMHPAVLECSVSI